MPLPPGSRVGAYEIVELIGRGGMGEVYRARDSRLKRDVALKVLPETLADKPDFVRRFEQEAQAAAALNHPNIVAVYDVGVGPGPLHVVSELLEGKTLRSALEAGPISVRQAIEWASQIAEGLAAAHDKGIVHRDIKPENVFMTEGDRVKILDFGLAKVRDDSRSGQRAHAGDTQRHRSRDAPRNDRIYGAGTGPRRHRRRARRHLQLRCGGLRNARRTSSVRRGDSRRRAVGDPVQRTRGPSRRFSPGVRVHRPAVSGQGTGTSVRLRRRCRACDSRSGDLVAFCRRSATTRRSQPSLEAVGGGTGYRRRCRPDLRVAEPAAAGDGAPVSLHDLSSTGDDHGDLASDPVFRCVARWSPHCVHRRIVDPGQCSGFDHSMRSTAPY